MALLVNKYGADAKGMLWRAAVWGDVATIQLLVERGGVDVHAFGRDMVCLAGAHGVASVVALLVERYRVEIHTWYQAAMQFPPSGQKGAAIRAMLTKRMEETRVPDARRMCAS